MQGDTSWTSRWRRRAAVSLLALGVLASTGCSGGGGMSGTETVAPVSVLGATQERSEVPDNLASRAEVVPVPTTVRETVTTLPGVVVPPPTAPPATAPPVTAPPVTAPPTTAVEVPPESVAALALTRISFPWRSALRGWRVEFLGPRKGTRGLTYTYERRIEIFVRPTDTPASLAHVIAHEIGHALDLERLTTEERAAWRAARGFQPNLRWWAGDGVDDFGSASGDFAESFAWWQVRHEFHSRLGPPPTASQIALMAAMLQS